MTAGTPGSLSYDNEIYPIPKKHHYKVVRRYTCVHRNNSKEDTVPCRIYGEAMHNGDLKVLKWYRNHSILRAFYAAEFRAAAKHNHYHVLEWGLTIPLLGFATSETFPKYFVNTAVRRSNWKLLNWIEGKTGKTSMISRFAFTTAVNCATPESTIDYLINSGWKVPADLYNEAVVSYRDDNLIRTLNNLYKYLPPSAQTLTDNRIYRRVLGDRWYEDERAHIRQKVLVWLRSHGFNYRK